MNANSNHYKNDKEEIKVSKYQDSFEDLIKASEKTKKKRKNKNKKKKKKNE